MKSYVDRIEQAVYHADPMILVDGAWEPITPRETRQRLSIIPDDIRDRDDSYPVT